MLGSQLVQLCDVCMVALAACSSCLCLLKDGIAGVHHTHLYYYKMDLSFIYMESGFM